MNDLVRKQRLKLQLISKRFVESSATVHVDTKQTISDQSQNLNKWLAASQIKGSKAWTDEQFIKAGAWANSAAP